MTSLRANLAELQTRRTDLVAALGLAESGASVDASWISGTFVHIARLWPLILLGKLCITALLHVPLYGDGNAGHAVALAAMLPVDGVAIVLPRGARFQLLRPHHQKWLMLPMVLLSGLRFSLILGQALIAGAPSDRKSTRLNSSH